MKTTPHLSNYHRASLSITSTSAILILAIVLFLFAGGCGTKTEWSESEQEDIDRFVSTIDYYELAAMTTADKLPTFITDEDWETVSANFQTAYFTAQQIDPATLTKIHPELNDHYQDEFMRGLAKGIYGLQAKTSQEKGDITRTYVGAQDSIIKGRQLLEAWLVWYDTNQATIIEKIK